VGLDESLKNKEVVNRRSNPPRTDPALTQPIHSTLERVTGCEAAWNL
jgi:hypothetical protein